jgi:hypothetical protein
MDASEQKSVRIHWYQNVKVLTLIVGILLVLVGCSKPLYNYLGRSQEQRWERAVSEENRQLKASIDDLSRSNGAAVDFGRELDTLTGFYEAVISILLGLLALVAGLAFWTIKVVTKSQAEETAMEAARSILGGHDSFKKRLEEVVSEAVSLRMEEINAKLEEYSVPASMVVTNPDQDPPGGGPGKSPRKPRQRKPSRKSEV